MTQVLIVRSKNGELQSCLADGHACFSVKGKDIVCAAVTTLLRTTLEVLENIDGINVTADLASRGKLVFNVEHDDSISIGSLNKVIFAGDFLETGMQRLAREYPKNVTVRVQISN
ncbi:MAG: hypothetical protein BKP49_06675 [Treponema sp. CETP13]|nr:MAG: hypothetical protein BKP49_06675 [Treponema sp. CETP13]